MNDVAFLKVLRISAFRNLWLSQVISQVFLNLLMFSLIIRVYEITRSNTAVSLVVLTTILPNIVIGWLAGILVDLWNRKAVMFFSHFLRVFAVLAFLISSESLLWIYIMTILIGVITQFFLPAEGATIPAVVTSKKYLLTANSLFTLTFFSSVVLGNVLAGPILQAFGIRLTFVIVAGAFTLASFFTAKLPGKSVWSMLASHRKDFLSGRMWKIAGIRRQNLLENFLEGIDHLHRTPIVRKAIVFLGIGQLLIAILGSVAPGFADKVLDIEPTQVSLLVMAPAAFGMIIGAAAVGQFFRGFLRQNLISAGVFCASLVLLAFSQVDRLAFLLGLPIVPVSAIVLIFLGMANSFLEVPINTLIQENTPEAVRSRIYGVISTVVGVAAIVPVVAAGTIADLFGVRVVIMLSGLTLLAVGLFNQRKIYVASS